MNEASKVKLMSVLKELSGVHQSQQDALSGNRFQQIGGPANQDVRP